MIKQLLNSSVGEMLIVSQCGIIRNDMNVIHVLQHSTLTNVYLVVIQYLFYHELL